MKKIDAYEVCITWTDSPGQKIYGIKISTLVHFTIKSML